MFLLRLFLGYREGHTTLPDLTSRRPSLWSTGKVIPLPLLALSTGKLRLSRLLLNYLSFELPLPHFFSHVKIPISRSIETFF
ncbi:uncharacterized protein DFL_006799 [Arthrobotrys flagrans]|uniref:Uncharacterized protein n=1 Tax=Arthrobotrys flagrans TaxID=97331 RepID=A0A436ZUD6_ARTFL|nr:hypothetical protein DFL_006799 [Arthrobotrys flagrans]